MKKPTVANYLIYCGISCLLVSFLTLYSCSYYSSGSEEISDTTGPGGTDFVFGYNELTEQIVACKIDDLSGIYHGHRISPRDPSPGEQVTATMAVGPGVHAREHFPIKNGYSRV